MDANLVFFSGNEVEPRASLEHYQSLEREQTDLRRRLSQDIDAPPSDQPERSQSISSDASMSPTSTAAPSGASSPRRRSACAPVSPDARRLFDVDNQIKVTLTDMLNCRSVKQDPASRSWIQSRLMATQLELKEQRRRRSEELADKHL